MTETELIARLERLERDNRRLKGLGMAAVMIAATLGLMAATRPVPDVIKAHSFEAVDGSGRDLVKISATDVPGSPRIMIYGDRHVSDVAILGYGDGSAAISLGPESRLKAFGGEFRSRVLISTFAGSAPSIALSDPQGHEMDLGGTIIRKIATGATQYTSADSIIMWGNSKDHRAIWRAP